MTHKTKDGANDHYLVKPEQQKVFDKYFNFTDTAVRRTRPNTDTWLKDFMKKQRQCSIQLLLSYMPTFDEVKLRRAQWSLEQLKG